MKKQLLNIPIKKDFYKKYGFAFIPVIALEAHPENHIWHLIWLEPYEIDKGRKWVIK